MDKNWLDFGDLCPIFKIAWGLSMSEIVLSVPYLRKERMGFDQTCTDISLGRNKNWLDFGGIDSIFKDTHVEGLRMSENSLYALSIQKEWIDFD